MILLMYVGDVLYIVNNLDHLSILVDFILSDNSALYNCAKALDVDCVLAAVSSSTASLSGPLDRLPEAIVVQRGFQIISNISFDIWCWRICAILVLFWAF